jgi:hypothetical protein
MQKKLIFILCLVSLNSFGQEYFWSTAQLAGTNSQYFSISNLAMTSLDEKVVIGSYSNTLYIDDETLSTDSLFSIYLAKFNSYDSLLWSKNIVEYNNESDLSISNVYVDNENNIYVTLHQRAQISVDSLIIGSEYLSFSHINFSILKYNPLGEFLNYYTLKGDCRNVIKNIDFDMDNNIYLMFGLWDFDDECQCVIDNDTIAINNTMSFILKLDLQLHDVFISSFTGSGNKLKYDDGFLYIGGSSSYYTIPVDFGNLIIDFPSFYDHGSFCSKMDTTGDIKWAKYFGVRGWDSHITISNIDMLSPNDIIVLGYSFSQSEPNKIYFENAPTLNGNSWDSNDYFIVNYDSLGQVKWHTKSSNSGDEYAVDMVYNEDLEEIYIAGSFDNYISFNGSTYSSTSDDIMVLCYDIEGNEKWIKFAGGAGMDKAWAIALDSQNNIYVNGSTSSNPSQFGAHSYTTENGANVFLAKMEYSAIGIEEIQDEDLMIKISPNPNAGTFTIRSDKYDIKGLIIYDLLGKELYKKSLDSPTQELYIQLQNCTQGTYIALVETEEGALVPKKIILNSTN